MIKLLDKYKELLENNNEKKGSFTYINNEEVGKVLKNVNIIEFDNLYIRLSIAIYNEGFLPESEKYNIEQLKKYIDDKSNDIITLGSKVTHPRAYFGYLAQKYKKENFAFLITSYMNYVMLDIIKENNVIYIDTDFIFYNGDINLDYLGLKHDKYSIEYLTIISPKRFVTYSIKSEEELPKYLISNKNDGFTVRGYHEKNINNAKPYIETIKNKLREDNIDYIIN